MSDDVVFFMHIFEVCLWPFYALNNVIKGPFFQASHARPARKSVERITRYHGPWAPDFRALKTAQVGAQLRSITASSARALKVPFGAQMVPARHCIWEGLQILALDFFTRVDGWGCSHLESEKINKQLTDNKRLSLTRVNAKDCFQYALNSNVYHATALY